MNDLIIPKAGTPVTAEQLCRTERQLAKIIPTITDVEYLEELRQQARALEEYLRHKNMRDLMLGSERRLEGRLGQLLPNHQGKQLQQHDFKVHSSTLADFRVIAHALTGECPLDASEWRKSRRALVKLIDARLNGPIPEADDTEEDSSEGRAIIRVRGFLYRAAEAFQNARYDLEGLELTLEMHEAAKKVVEEWSKVVERFNEKTKIENQAA